MAEAPLISGQLCPAHRRYLNARRPTKARGSYEVTAAGFVPRGAAWGSACPSLHPCLVLRSLLRETDRRGKACAPFLACRPRHEGTAGNSIAAVSHAGSPAAAARGRTTGTNPQLQHQLLHPRPRSVRRRCAVPPWRTRTPRGRRPPANPPAKPLTFG